jgi:hypothetical protein
MSTIKPQDFHASPWRLGALVVVLGGIGAGGALAGAAGHPGGWMAAALLLPLAGVLAWRLFSGRPEFTVSSSAVTLRNGTSVPWGDVERIELRSVRGRRHGAPTVTIELHRDRGSVVRLGLNHLQGAVDEVVARIEAASGRPVDRG